MSARLFSGSLQWIVVGSWLACSAVSAAALAADSDGDGIADNVDNCIFVPNPDQRDTNGNGVGNACDGDLNNDGVVNALDLGLFKKAFGNSTNPDADFNGDGRVNALDLGRFKQMFSKPPGPSGVPRYAINPRIVQGPGSLPDAGLGSIPLAAVSDKKGIVSRFVANEVLLKGSKVDLDAFLAKFSGRVLFTINATPKILTNFYRIRVESSSVQLLDLQKNLSKAGFTGLTTFSSNQGAQLAAIIMRESAAGRKGVALNFVSEGHLLNGTTEQSDVNGVADAFKWKEFDNHAWQFIQASGIQRRAKVAIIDGGFWLNNQGVPCDIAPAPTTTACNASNGAGPKALGVSDLPNLPFQFDTITGGAFAGGVNPNQCTNGAACPWHGNQTASVILGTLNNRAGAAGVGGQVADPLLFKTDGTDTSIAAGIVDAVGAGADIINLSLGGPCGDLCQYNHSLVMNGIMDQALDSGVLVVASAGNNNVNALDTHIWPCQYSSASGHGVFCVGALAWINSNGIIQGSGYSAGTSFRKASYSNYGSTVNIWAPTHIRAMPNGDSSAKLTTHDGTSASAPFVSGVAAMCKAVNRDLDANGIKDIINNTALIDNDPLGNPDPLVSRMIQPYAAVVACSGGYHLFPELQITSPAPNATVVPDQNGVGFAATVSDVQDGKWPLVTGYRPQGPTKVTWTSDVDGPLPNNSDTSASFDFLSAPEGLRHITARVTNSAGKTTFSTIAITTKYPHLTPVPVITSPPAGATVQAGTQTVTGYAKSTDPGVLGNFDCSQLVWNGSVASTPVPNSDTCQAQLTFTPGVFQVALSVTGRFGDVGVTTENVNVVAPVQLSPVILSPGSGSTALIYNANGTIGMLASAAPVNSGDNLFFVWLWYYTANGPSTAQLVSPIAASENGASENWNVTPTGICSLNDNGVIRNVSLQVYATETPPGSFVQNFDGRASVDFQIDCVPLR